MSEKEILEFFDAQMQSWPEARMRVDNLKRVQLKRLYQDNIELDIQYNPDRIVSTAAKTDQASIKARPCFLCQQNQPQEQGRMVIWDKYNLCVNPYPILNRHFTLSTIQHQPQALAEHITDMCRLALELPSMVIFYNGPHSGASAPDHMHFQLGAKGQIPLQRDWELLEPQLRKIFSPEEENGLRGIYIMETSVIPVIVIRGNCEHCGTKLYNQLIQVLPTLAGENEPRINAFAWNQEGKLVLCIIPRTKHRPSSYSAEGSEGTFCISPGCVDMGGLIITPLAKDFHSITALQATQILKEVTLPQTDVEKYLSQIPSSQCKNS